MAGHLVVEKETEGLEERQGGRERGGRERREGGKGGGGEGKGTDREIGWGRWGGGGREERQTQRGINCGKKEKK